MPGSSVAATSSTVIINSSGAGYIHAASKKAPAKIKLVIKTFLYFFILIYTFLSFYTLWILVYPQCFYT